MGCTLFALGHLRHLARGYGLAQYFSEKAIVHLNRFSFWLFVGFLAKLLQPALTSLILTATNPAGEKALVLQLNNDTLSTLFIAAVFYLLTQIMKEGLKLAEENAEII